MNDLIDRVSDDTQCMIIIMPNILKMGVYTKSCLISIMKMRFHNEMKNWVFDRSHNWNDFYMGIDIALRNQGYDIQ